MFSSDFATIFNLANPGKSNFLLLGSHVALDSRILDFASSRRALVTLSFFTVI